MEVEEIQAQACGNSKFPRIGNGRIGDPKLAQHKDHLLLHNYNPGNDHDDNDDDDNHNNENENDNHAHRVGPEIKRPSNALVSVAAVDNNVRGGGGNRLRGWHHSSRIIRVSRASGGKDRHSKVWTSKGLRDRRVRLSVMTAIQFYDLQDRLGCDQPSKAVEWLINAAADAIAELPSLNTASFPDTPKQLSDEKRAATAEHGFDSANVELELDPADAATGFHHHQQNQNQNQQHLSLSKSACSSTSETSKGSGLSLSRSEMKVNRTKARERARERAAKDKEIENPSTTNAMTNINTISHNASFTELLTAGINTVNSSNHNNTSSSPTTAAASEHQNFFHKPSPATAAMAQMDYFATLGLSSSSSTSLRPHQQHQHHHHTSSSSPFPGQIHLGNSLPMSMSMSMSMSIPPPFGISVIPGGDAEPLQAQHHFSFVPEQHLIPVAAAAAAAPSQTGNGGGGDYSLNFSIASSGLAGFNRGTLQSNSSVQSSLLPHHLQRFSSPIDGSTNVPFFFGAAAAPPLESHHHQHQFPAGFDGRLQLCYGDGSRHSDQKGKGKN